MSAPDRLRDEAAEWVVRLGAESVEEAEHAVFREWLATVPGARDAYDHALDVWLPKARATSAVRRSSRAAPSRRSGSRPAPNRYNSARAIAHGCANGPRSCPSRGPWAR